jgi:hypothetical protein
MDIHIFVEVIFDVQVLIVDLNLIYYLQFDLIILVVVVVVVVH